MAGPTSGLLPSIFPIPDHAPALVINAYGNPAPKRDSVHVSTIREKASEANRLRLSRHFTEHCKSSLENQTTWNTV